MIASRRSPLAVALAALALAEGCGGPFSLIYCEGDAPRPIHCDCTTAPREVAGGRVGRVEIREYDRTGALKRHYRQGRDLPFVLLDHWLVIAVQSRQSRPMSLQAWLRCDDATIAGEVVHRAVDRDASGPHDHEYLALFPGARELGDTDTPICWMHVAYADASGWTITRAAQRVYAVGRARRTEPIAGLTWGVTIADDPAPTPAEIRAELERPLPPPGPRLCRTGAPP